MIRIVTGRKGVHLKIDGLFINHGFNKEIKAILSEGGIPYGATEWVSVNAVREFWNMYRVLIVAALNKPVRSEWGKLKFQSI